MKHLYWRWSLSERNDQSAADHPQCRGSLQCFTASPQFFRRYLNRYLTHATEGHTPALADTKAHVFASGSYEQTWKQLLPADQEVLRLLADGITSLHSAQTRKKLGQALGLDRPPHTSTAAHALARLERELLVSKLDYGEYQIIDQEFAEWVRMRPLE